MKKLNNCKWFVLGIAVCLITVTMVVPAIAASITKKNAQLEYSDMKIALNGNTVTPKDANGNTVDPFVIDGTTYLPVRAIGNALGMGVDWDKNTNTVLLTSGSSNNGSAAYAYMELHNDYWETSEIVRQMNLLNQEFSSAETAYYYGYLDDSFKNNIINQSEHALGNDGSFEDALCDIYLRATKYIGNSTYKSDTDYQNEIQSLLTLINNITKTEKSMEIYKTYIQSHLNGGPFSKDIESTWTTTYTNLLGYSNQCSDGIKYTLQKAESYTE